MTLAHRNKVQLSKFSGCLQQISIIQKDGIYFELDKQDNHFKMNVLKIILITNNRCKQLFNVNEKIFKNMKFNKYLFKSITSTTFPKVPSPSVAQI